MDKEIKSFLNDLGKVRDVICRGSMYKWCRIEAYIAATYYGTAHKVLEPVLFINGSTVFREFAAIWKFKVSNRDKYDIVDKYEFKEMIGSVEVLLSILSKVDRALKLGLEICVSMDNADKTIVEELKRLGFEKRKDPISGVLCKTFGDFEGTLKEIWDIGKELVKEVSNQALHVIDKS